MTEVNSASPFSTGSGGATFEQLVGVHYLTDLLSQDIPRGLTRGITKNVSFQQKYKGALLDDIVVESETSQGILSKLAIQVKHDLSFGVNETFKRVIKDCWLTFNNSNSGNWKFNRGLDRLGIITGSYNSNVDQHLQRVLDWVRTSISSQEFFTRINAPKIGSASMRRYVSEVFYPILNEVEGKEVSQDELVEFLKHLTIMHFDLEHFGARDTTIIWNRLLSLLKVRDEAIGRNLAAILLLAVTECTKTAGGFNLEILRHNLKDFSLDLIGTVNCQKDIDILRDHTDRVIGNISNSIGNKIILPRANSIAEVKNAIKKIGIRYIGLTGQPGSGKSGILKLLVDNLRQEGDIIATNIDRLEGSTLEDFQSKLKLQNSFQDLLDSMSSGPLRCLFIDGFEKVLGDRNRETVLNDLLQEIDKYNRRIIAQGGHDWQCWRVIFSCRKDAYLLLVENNNYLLNAARENSLNKCEIGALEQEELDGVVNQFPRLTYLNSHDSIRTLLRLPFYLDLLTRVENPLRENELPEVLSEVWFLNFFWEKVIKNPKEPLQCGNTLLEIVRRKLQTHNFLVNKLDLDEGALTSLKSQGIIYEQDLQIAFTHDLYADWTGEKLVAANQDDFSQFLKDVKFPNDLFKPLQLRALYFLEIKQNYDAWLRIIEKAQDFKVPPSLRDCLISALFSSPSLANFMIYNESVFLSNQMRLLNPLLRLMRTEQTIISTLGQIILNETEDSFKKDYINANYRQPIVEKWLPILRLLLINLDSLVIDNFLELAKICKLWLSFTNIPLKKDIGNLCLKALVKPLTDFVTTDDTGEDSANNQIEEKFDYRDQQYRIESVLKEARLIFLQSLLLVVDTLPDEIKTYIRSDLENISRSEVETNLLQEQNWVRLAYNQPDFFVEVAAQILCWFPELPERIEPLHQMNPQPIEEIFSSEDYQWSLQDFSGGTKNDHEWHSDSYDAGPFYYFLKMHPEHGIDLIMKVINHSTFCWKKLQELGFTRLQRQSIRVEPMAQSLVMGDGSIQEIWGDDKVYMWMTNHFCGSHATEIALRALEAWLYEQLNDAEKLSKYIDQILKSTASLAPIRTLISIFLKDPSNIWLSVKPILTSAFTWVLEPIRYSSELNFRTWIFGNPTLSHDTDELKFEKLKELALMPHRSKSLLETVLDLAISSSDDQKFEIIDMLASLGKLEIPLFFTHEQQNLELINYRKFQLLKISACGNQNNWQYQQITNPEDGSVQQLLSSIQLPQEVLDLQGETPIERLWREKRLQIWGLENWASHFRDKGEIGEGFSLERVIDFVEKSDELYTIGEEVDMSNVLLNIRAMLIAGMLIHQFNWLKSNNKLKWAIKFLFEIDPTKNVSEENYPVLLPPGISHSIIKTIPHLLNNSEEIDAILYIKPIFSRIKRFIFREDLGHSSKSTSFNEDFTNLILRMVRFAQYGDQEYLYAMLRSLWQSYPDLVYKCLREAMTYRAIIRQFAGRNDSENPISPLIKSDFFNKKPPEINFPGLSEILEILPSSNELDTCSYATEIKDFVTKLIDTTKTAYLRTRKDKYPRNPFEDHLFGFLIDWKVKLAHFLANWTRDLPFKEVEQLILNPFISNWETLNELIEEYIYVLSENFIEGKLKTGRFLEVWQELATEILNSEKIIDVKYYPSYRNQSDVLAALIFANQFARTEVAELIPISQLNTILELWINRLAHTNDGFIILVRFMRKTQITTVKQKTVSLLLESWTKLTDKEQMLNNEGYKHSLALLFNELFYLLPPYQGDIEILGKFTNVIDVLASQGESLAIETQRKLRNLK